MKKLRESSRYLSEVRLRRLLKIRKGSRQYKPEHSTPHIENARNAAITNRINRLNLYRDLRHSLTVTFRVPRIFDLLENSKETLEFILKLASVCESNRTVLIQLDYSGCQKLGLAAESLVSFLCKVLVDRKKSVRGLPSKNEEVNRLHWGIGTPQKLGFNKFSETELKSGRIRVFDQRIHYIGAEPLRRPSIKEKLSSDFVQHLNKCLTDHGYEFNSAGEQYLHGYFGEIVDNAEQHAGLIDYTVVSFLDNGTDGSSQVQIAIYNFGRSIAESFTDLPRSDPARSEVQEYIDHHRKGGIFSAGWEQDDLFTLVALQEFVSSKNNSPDIRRGDGTVQFIEFFQKIYEAVKPELSKGVAPPAMAIISGNTEIYFDGTYKMKNDSSGRRVIAFNEDNNLRLAPDKRFVKHLDWIYFPGTVINIRFPLPPSFITKR